jgi:hypothetical protein
LLLFGSPLGRVWLRGPFLLGRRRGRRSGAAPLLGREAGLRELIAKVLSENVPMLNVFERSGLAMSTRQEGTVVHVTLRYS